MSSPSLAPLIIILASGRETKLQAHTCVKYHISIIIIFSGSTVLVRTLASSHRSFVILLGLLWTSDQPVAKAPTYIGQSNTETQKQTSMPRAGFEPTTLVTKLKTYDLDRAANGTGSWNYNFVNISL
jgi:hypothetical protein